RCGDRSESHRRIVAHRPAARLHRLSRRQRGGKLPDLSSLRNQKVHRNLVQAHGPGGKVLERLKSPGDEATCSTLTRSVSDGRCEPPAPSITLGAGVATKFTKMHG